MIFLLISSLLLDTYEDNILSPLQEAIILSIVFVFAGLALLQHRHQQAIIRAWQQQAQLQSLAICLGTEAVGCTEELLQAADLRVYLPLRGFADSLNLSVATALILHHLCTVLEPRFFDRHEAMTETERVALRRAWYTKLAQQRLLTGLGIADGDLALEQSHRGVLELLVDFFG